MKVRQVAFLASAACLFATAAAAQDNPSASPEFPPNKPVVYRLEQLTGRMPRGNFFSSSSRSWSGRSECIATQVGPFMGLSDCKVLEGDPLRNTTRLRLKGGEQPGTKVTVIYDAE